jgi:hypothetical protein
MENIKKFKMRRLFVGLLTLSLVFTSCEDFLEEYSTIGLSADKLIDINAMNSLNAGAYSNLRNMTSYEHMQSTTLVRDVLLEEVLTGNLGSPGQMQECQGCLIDIQLHIKHSIR